MNVVCFRRLVAAVVVAVAVTVGFAGGGGGGQRSCGGESVRIGGKTWMTTNINVSTADSWCYDDDASNCARYGRLYTWDAAMSACPSGWRLPTREDWNDLVAEVGDSVAGTKLKAVSPGWDGTDDFCFSALPGGDRWGDGSFYHVGNYGLWWTATEYGSDRAYRRGMSSDSSDVYECWNSKSYGFSVRCVRD